MEGHLPVIPNNQAAWDRALRVVVGVAIFALGVSGIFPESVGAVLRIASLVPLLTGAFGTCPFYIAAGVSTLRAAHRVDRELVPGD